MISQIAFVLLTFSFKMYLYYHISILPLMVQGLLDHSCTLLFSMTFRHSFLSCTKFFAYNQIMSSIFFLPSCSCPCESNGPNHLSSFSWITPNIDSTLCFSLNISFLILSVQPCNSFHASPILYFHCLHPIVPRTHPGQV